MKTKLTSLIIGDCIRYTVQYKDHWWSRWRYVMDGRYPRLFKEEELSLIGLIDHKSDKI